MSHPSRLRLLRTGLLGGVFLVSGILKLSDRGTHDHAPEWLTGDIAGAVTFIVAVVELLLACSLFLRWRPRVALGFSFALILGFWGVMLALHLSGASPSACGCFGQIEISFRGHYCLLAGMFLVTATELSDLPDDLGRPARSDLPPV